MPTKKFWRKSKTSSYPHATMFTEPEKREILKTTTKTIIFLQIDLLSMISIIRGPILTTQLP